MTTKQGKDDDVKTLVVDPIKNLLKAGLIVGLDPRAMTRLVLDRLAEDQARDEHTA